VLFSGVNNVGQSNRYTGTLLHPTHQECVQQTRVQTECLD